MRKIFKYPLRLEDKQTVTLPFEHNVLSVGVQLVNEDFLGAPIVGEGIMLWAMIDENNYPVHKTVDRTIHIIGTGNSIPNVELKFIGTVQLQKGKLVFHVFLEL